MKIRRIITILLAIFILISSTSAFAGIENPAEIRNNDKAVVLNKLGLFMGSSEGFKLEKQPTRLEAAVMLVRLLGKESDAKKNNFSHPFTDVPSWASPYIGYMYKNGLTKGVSAKNYGSMDATDIKQYCTFLLRSLGYSDVAYNSSLEYAWDIGLITKSEFEYLGSKTFLRDDMVGLSYDSLATQIKNSPKRLINKLIEEMVIDAKVADDNGIDTSEEFYEVSDFGEIDGIPFFKDITIGIDPSRGGNYQALIKNLWFRIDKDSLPAEIKDYIKVARYEISGQVNAAKIKAAIESIMDTKRFFEEHTYQHDENGNCLIGCGSGNAIVFVVTDRSDNIKGYSLIIFKGYKETEALQDITNRYNKVDAGEIDGIKFLDVFSIHRIDKYSCIIRVDSDKLTGQFKSFKKCGLLTISGWKTMTEEEKKQNLSKWIKSAATGDYNEDPNKMSSGSTGTTMLLFIADANGNPLGYCLLDKK